MTDEEVDVEKETFQMLFKKKKIDILGLMLFVLFILTACYYVYARSRYSLADLGPLLWYGVLIFALEIFGAISIAFYGIWLIAKPDNTDIRDIQESMEQAKPRRRYHIRVLIPCYKESLLIVQRTVIAAHTAVVPPGCQVTVYLCDDGNDPAKRDFITKRNSPSLVYITGRVKSKSTNGKSENLNYVLTQCIYKNSCVPRSDGKPTIPLTELVCLLDADQTCSRQKFFPTLLAYIDSGDNIGAALSPQYVFNASHGDILNHQNIPFWEKLQPGMDALGFISLTGTNMILRARTLQECGWFPTNTVTEDWALGMQMKRRGWALRYCSEYLAAGEAPEELRQAIQQRSRWCKGHFQIFWSKACPLFDKGLTTFYKLTYSATCLSYTSVGLLVPVMTIVPIITLLFGYFPIALNFHTVLAITLFYIVLNMLTYYCNSFREYKALWLSNTATIIFWWPFLKASVLTPMKSCLGRGLTFKSTAKGSASVAASITQVLPWVFLNLLSVVAFLGGIIKISSNPTAPEVIALCWVVYNVIPHFLLVIYAYTGQSRVLNVVVNICIAVSGFVSIFALVALWIFYPRNADYDKAGDGSIKFLSAQRAGPLPEDFSIKWRADSSLQYVGTANMTTVGSGSDQAATFSDLSGGFHNDGDIGAVKLPFNVALTTTMLAWSLLDFPGFWSANSARLNTAIELVMHGSDFIHNCYHSTEIFEESVFVYQVGNIRTEHKLWRPPEASDEQYVLSVSGADAPLDLAGQFVAAMVSSALALDKYERADPIGSIDRAHFLFSAVTDIADEVDSSGNVTGLYTKVAYSGRPSGISSAALDEELLDSYYPSNSFRDDLFWAASWLARASESYRKFDSEFYFTEMRAHQKAAYSDEGDISAVSYDYLNNAAIVHAASFTVDESYHRGAQSFLYDWLCDSSVSHTALGRACQSESPRLGSTVKAAALAIAYTSAVRNNPKLNGVYSSRLLKAIECFAQAQGRYVLGVGSALITPTSSVIGYSARGFDKTWHRGATCPPFPSPCGDQYSPEANNQPDENTISGGLLWADTCTDSNRERRGRTQSTVISLENNAGMPLLWAGLQQDSRPWVQCLQGEGVFTSGRVCKIGRPKSERLGPDVSLDVVDLQ